MKSPDHLLRHSILLMAASQVGNVSSVVFHMFMGRWLAPAEYGVLSSMLSVVLIAGMPLGALGTVLTFFSAQLLLQNRAGDILPLMRVWALKLLLIAGPLLVIGILFSQPLAGFFKLPDRSALFMVLIILTMTFFTPIIGAPLGGMQAFGWASISGISWGVVRLIVGAALVYFIAASAKWALVGHGVGVIVSVGIAMAGLWVILRKSLPTDQALPGTHAYLWRTLVVMACFSFLMSADMLIVKHYFTPEQSGLYARAATIGRMIVFLPMPIAGALFPKTVSNGGTSARHNMLLWKALFFTAIIIVPGALVCALFPQLPLGVLYHDWQPDAAMCRLVRCTIWAMSPLGLACIVMNFELSQNRFRIILPLILCVAGYLTGVALWHVSVLQIVAILATASVLALLALVWWLPWRGIGGWLFLDILPPPNNHSNIKTTLNHAAVVKRGTLSSERGNQPFDFRKAALNLRRRVQERMEQRRRLFEKADAQAKRIVAMAIEKYSPRRIYVWGSLLRPEQFDENSDIDIAVGVSRGVMPNQFVCDAQADGKHLEVGHGVLPY